MHGNFEKNFKKFERFKADENETQTSQKNILMEKFMKQCLQIEHNWKRQEVLTFTLAFFLTASTEVLFL